ncbi:hypothetical protein [Paraburkholderia acidiphila]|uniref:Uncharacterized protein n=1 Tax=Paraburkholderia acidiphila TaxID=2571747 RepID=A0A7Z2JAI4_9BURK|nr:hypothetical protein [Paraburkholderia acidiphila]QGZ56768.1 hypothetical protein FAZ97_17550 [Paraburkholderia acidiphila]
MADTLDFVIRQGANWADQFVAANDISKKPYNFTGATVHARLKSPQAGVTPVELTSYLTVTPLAGKLRWNLPFSALSAFPFPLGAPVILPDRIPAYVIAFYDFGTQWSSENIAPLLGGRLLVIPSTLSPF